MIHSDRKYTLWWCLGDTSNLKGVPPPRDYSSYKAHMKCYGAETWRDP